MIEIYEISLNFGNKNYPFDEFVIMRFDARRTKLKLKQILSDDS